MANTHQSEMVEMGYGGYHRSIVMEGLGCISLDYPCVLLSNQHTIWREIMAKLFRRMGKILRSWFGFWGVFLCIITAYPCLVAIAILCLIVRPRKIPRRQNYYPEPHHRNA